MLRRSKYTFPDPIFAAIAEREKVVEAANRVYEALSIAEAKGRKKSRPSKMTGLERRRVTAMDAVDCASMRMAKTRPGTPAGAAALLSYVEADVRWSLAEWHDAAISTVNVAVKAWADCAEGAGDIPLLADRLDRIVLQRKAEFPQEMLRASL
jgi:hypothetical protein